MKATINKRLALIQECYIMVPGGSGGGNSGNSISEKIVLDSLPSSLSLSKTANYAKESLPGRVEPLQSYIDSGARTISFNFSLYATQTQDYTDNILIIRRLESALYVKDGDNGFEPPPICKIKCGELFAKKEICVIMTSFSANFPNDVSWNKSNLCPMRIDVAVSFEEVHSSTDLPGQNQIISL